MASEAVIVASEAVTAKEEEAIEEIGNREATEIANIDETAANLTADKKEKKEDAQTAAAVVAADDGFGLWL